MEEIEKYKFIFEDSTTTQINAKGYADAAILAMANRIRANKDKKLCGAWAFDKESQTWQRLKQNRVEFSLNN